MKELLIKGSRRFAKPVLIFAGAAIAAVLLRQCDVDMMPALLTIEGMWK